MSLSLTNLSSLFASGLLSISSIGFPLTSPAKEISAKFLKLEFAGSGLATFIATSTNTVVPGNNPPAESWLPAVNVICALLPGTNVQLGS